MSILRQRQEERRGAAGLQTSSQIPEYHIVQEPIPSKQEGQSLLLRRKLSRQAEQPLEYTFQPPDDNLQQFHIDDTDQVADHGILLRQKPAQPDRSAFYRDNYIEQDPDESYEAYSYGGFNAESDMEDAGRFQEDLDNMELRRQYRRDKRKILMGRLARGIQWLLIVACVYIAFLIYGVTVTSYEYDAAGKVVPQSMAVEELAAAAEFSQVQGYYLRARGLYEITLDLDFRLANNPEAALLVASDYELLLEDVAKLSVDLNAAQFNTAYAQLKRQLLYWVQTDIAVYLQNISAAITQNNAEKGNQAIIGRDIMYNDFMLISENIAIYGQAVKGANLGEIYEWSPDKYIRKVLEGIQDE